MLVQRETIIARLESALDSSAAGNSTLVLIEGAVGCGKSELVEVVSARAADRAHIVLRATGTPCRSVSSRSWPEAHRRAPFRIRRGLRSLAVPRPCTPSPPRSSG
jgi:hypothetical protein